MSEVIGTFTVDPDEVLDFIMRLGANDWSTAVSYQINDYVRASDGWIYRCIEEHTSGVFSTDLSAARWEQYTDDEGQPALLWLDDANGEIVASVDSLTFDPTGQLTTVVGRDPAPADGGKAILIWFDASAASGTYKVAVLFTTNSSPTRTGERTLKIKVKG